MIGAAMYITIKSLRKKHKNKLLIARLTGHDWKTVAKKIKDNICFYQYKISNISN